MSSIFTNESQIGCLDIRGSHTTCEFGTWRGAIGCLAEGKIRSQRMENAASSPPEVKKRHSPFSENEKLIFRSRLSPLRGCAFTSLRFFIFNLLLLPTSVPVQSTYSPNTSQIFILHAINGSKGGVKTLPWIPSPNWLLGILNNFSFSKKFSSPKVVWLPLL